MTRSLADQIRTQAAIAARPGQAVVLERIADQVAELEAAQRPPLGYPSVDDMLGADPDWLGGQSVDDYIAETRGEKS